MMPLPSWLHWLSPLRHWHGVPLAEIRLVVVDVETTGLQVRKDSLLSIGAVAIERLRLDLAEQFECTLRAETDRARDNILVHGLAPSELERGRDPRRALTEFLEFVGDSPLIAFHASFDRRVLQHACRRQLGLKFRNPFMDAAEIAPALFPDRRPRQDSLDAWLDVFGLSASTRHNAAADALATAELMLILLNAARRQGIRDLEGLRHRVDIGRRLKLARGSGT